MESMKEIVEGFIDILLRASIEGKLSLEDSRKFYRLKQDYSIYEGYGFWEEEEEEEE